jgi:hypothetical protein
MSKSSEFSRLAGKEVEEKIDSTPTHRQTTHWYRFDPNRPTFDQLRAIERDKRRFNSGAKTRRVSESIKQFFQKVILWKL